jgi:putative endonuclease
LTQQRQYYVYILASWSKSLYIGVTNNLLRRVLEHKQRVVKGFAKRYRIHRLVYYEACSEVRIALQREKQIKSWRREKKVALVKTTNPEWKDLAASWLRSRAVSGQGRDPSPRLPAKGGLSGLGMTPRRVGV